MNQLRGLIKYQWLLKELVAGDLKIKYRKSVLGYLWSILNPLLMMTILTLVFSNMFRFDIENYPVYLLTGQLMFTFFAESTNMAMNSILSGAALIKKVYLPKYIFPISRVISSFTTMIFSLLALLIVMIVTDSEFHLTIIILPLVLIYVFIFSIGISLILSTIIVFFRDTQYLYGVLLTALNYLTPIFYPVNILPDWVKEIMVFNPMYNFIEMFRKIMIYGKWPELTEHCICILFSVGALMLGIYFFKKKQNNFILYI